MDPDTYCHQDIQINILPVLPDEKRARTIAYATFKGIATDRFYERWNSGSLGNDEPQTEFELVLCWNPLARMYRLEQKSELKIKGELVAEQYTTTFHSDIDEIRDLHDITRQICGHLGRIRDIIEDPEPEWGDNFLSFYMRQHNLLSLIDAPLPYGNHTWLERRLLIPDYSQM
ncbi:hypothetical protein ACVBEG_13600 [Pseudomonas sp. GG8]